MSESFKLTPDEEELYGINQPYKSIGQWLRTTGRGAVEGVIPAAVSMVKTDPSQEGVARAVPGSLASAYNMVSSIKDLVQMVPRLDPFGALGERQPIKLPGEDASREIARNVAANAVRDYAPTAETPEQATAQRVVAETFMGGPPVGGLVRNLPTAAREAVQWLAPAMAFPKLTLGVNSAVEAMKDDGGSGATHVADAGSGVTLPAPSLTSPAQAAPQPAQPAQPTTNPQDIPAPLQPVEEQRMDYDPSTGLVVPYTPDGTSNWTNASMLAAGFATLALAAGSRQAATVLRQRQLAKFPALSAELNSQLGGITAPTVAAPVPGVLATDRAAATLLDASAPLKRFANAIKATPQAGAALEDKIALLTDKGVLVGRLQSFANTGIDDVSGFRMLPWQKHWEKTAALDVAGKQQYTHARNAADELENRARTAGVAHNFPLHDDAKLKQIVAYARSNPELAALLDERRVMSDQMVDFMRARGMLTRADAARLKKAHRDFLPSSDAKGIIDNPLSSRDMTPLAGLDSIRMPAWELDKQHFEAIFRAAEHNDLVTSLVKPGLAFQLRDPRNAKLFEQVASKTDNFTIPYREAGQLKYVKVNSPELYHWIEGGPTQLSSFGGAMNYLRHMMQTGTLGPWAAMLGNVAAPKLGIYNGLISSVTRPQGTSYGLLDAGAQWLGFKPGIPGDLTGVALGQPYAVAADALSLGARAASEALEPGAGRISAMLRNTFGDAAINTVQNNLERRYAASVMAERRAAGNIGSAGQASTELPNIQPGAAQRDASVLNNMVPELFRSNNPKIGNIEVPIGKAMPTFIKVNELLHNVHRLMTESHASHYYRMNRSNVPRNRLNRETRRLTGNISDEGSGKVAQAVSNYIPWGNAAVQGGRRMAAVAADHPFQVASGLTTAVGVPALAAVFLAMSRGPEFINHLENELNSEQFGQRVVMHTGETPDQYSYITLPQEFRGPFAAAMSMAFDLLGNPADPEIRRMSLAGMADFFRNEVSTENQNRIMHGLASPLTLGLPPAADALLAATGKSVANDWLARSVEGKPALVNTTGQRSIPNVDKQIDPLTESEHGGMFKDIVSALFGGVAVNAFALATTYNNTRKWTDDKAFAVMNVLDNVGENLQSSVPFVNNMVWQQSMPLSTASPAADRVNAKTQAMQKLTGVQSDVRDEGYTRSRGLSLPIAPDQAHEVPTDPTMFSLYVVLGKLGPKIAQQVAPATDIRKQMDAARNGGYDPQTQREIVNTLNRQYQQKMRAVDEQLSAFEGHLSQMVGKRVEIDKIDFRKGPEQFTAPNVE